MRLNRTQVRAIVTLFSAASLPRKIAAAICLALALGAFLWQKPGEVSGTVIGIADGDTITVLDAGQTTHRIRFAFVDAPEKAQLWGQRARQALAERVFHRQVRVEVVDRDRYGREVGRVWLDEVDVNLAMLAEGHAWHYRQYAEGKQGDGDFVRYGAAERAARQARAGLWGDADPVPPWEYRRRLREP